MQHTAPDAVIFDFDGTLADTFPLVIAAWNAAMRATIGITFATDDIIARFGVPEAEMFRREFAGRGDDVWRQALDAYMATYESEHGMVQAFDGVSPTLQRLRAGGAMLGIMTSKGRGTLDITLRKLGWNGWFARTVAGDEVAAQKPDPEGPLLVASQMGVPPTRCAFVGDSAPDILAGRAAGMRTVAAGWHTVYADSLRAAQPDAWAGSPAEVPSLLGY